MKRVLFAGLLIVSFTVAMDHKKIIVTLDPNKLSLTALEALFNVMSRCQSDNVYMNRNVSLEVRMVTPSPPASVNTDSSLLIREFVKDFPNFKEILQPNSKL